MSYWKCVVCGFEAGHHEQADNHLKHAHPGPFKFWMDGREFETKEPSMTVGQIKSLTGTSSQYQFFLERLPVDAAFSDGQAVDLTHEPRFYCIPPATMFG